jgi:uncharacterized protein
MFDIQLKLDKNKRGAFVIEEGSLRLADMSIGIEEERIIVYHTEVKDALKGKGIAQQLLSALANYARQNHLKVVALCPFTAVQFKRHPELYGDIEMKNWHPSSQTKSENNA